MIRVVTAHLANSHTYPDSCVWEVDQGYLHIYDASKPAMRQAAMLASYPAGSWLYVRKETSQE